MKVFPVCLVLLFTNTLSALKMSIKPITLITFDVDGTLVRGSTVIPETTIHAKAFLHAAGKVMKGIDSFETQHNSPVDFIPSSKYHGSTDGLILLNLVKSAFNIPVEESAPKLPELFRAMYDYVACRSDEVVCQSIVPIPGVKETLTKLIQDAKWKDHVLCGLVTGNVEGIARKKMRACEMYQLGFLSPKAPDQVWEGENDAAFLGGFGSDYCSQNIDDPTKGYDDRGEQIVIAYERACQLLLPHEQIVRVVHVGDAPSDVLAAKYCADHHKFPSHVTVGCIGVATGSYSLETLQACAGERIATQWEPVVLAEGVADEHFLEHCHIRTDSLHE